MPDADTPALVSRCRRRPLAPCCGRPRRPSWRRGGRVSNPPRARRPGGRTRPALRCDCAHSPSMSVSRTLAVAMRSRVMTGTPAVVKRTPSHRRRHPTRPSAGRPAAPRRRCGSGPTALLAKTADPGLFGDPQLVLGGALGELGRCQRAHDLDLVAVDLDGGAALEPVLGDPAGEPRPDQPLLLRARRWWRGRATASALRSPSGTIFFCIHITRLHDYVTPGKGPSG